MAKEEWSSLCRCHYPKEEKLTIRKFMKNFESDVPYAFNAMLRRILDKYPYLDGWYSSKGSAAIINEETDKLDLDKFIEWISISENENPFGHYVMKIIDCNKSIVNIYYYKYGGIHKVKFLDKIQGSKLTIDEMEKEIERVMWIIEDKKRELKEQEIKNKLNNIKNDFK